jgi:hypothetical protein
MDGVSLRSGFGSDEDDGSGSFVVHWDRNWKGRSGEEDIIGGQEEREGRSVSASIE